MNAIIAKISVSIKFFAPTCFHIFRHFNLYEELLTSLMIIFFIIVMIIAVGLCFNNRKIVESSSDKYLLIESSNNENDDDEMEILNSENSLYRSDSGVDSNKGENNNKFNFVGIIVLFIGVTYVPILSLCGSIFQCSDSPEGFVLTYDPSLSCDSNDHTLMAIFASVVIILLGVGYPLFIFFQIRKFYKENSLYEKDKMKTYGFIYLKYKPKVIE